MKLPTNQNPKGRPRTRLALRGLILCILAAGLSLTTSPRGAAIGRLQNSAASPETLAAQVLAAMVQGNIQALRELALSEEEFRQYVWPELPASNPRTNVPFEFVWNDVAYRSAIWMNRMTKDLCGKQMKLVRVLHRGKTVPYHSHQAWSDMVVVLSDELGREREYPLFGTLIEMDGRFKVYSYAPYD